MALAPLVGSLIIIGFANAVGPIAVRLPLSVASVLIGGALCWRLPAPPAQEDAEPASKGFRIALVGTLIAVVGYVLYAGFFTLDTDNWVHEPLIATYASGLFPPQHPFFEGVELKGHYGRDLLIASLLPHGTDPLAVVWLLNPVLALASAGVLIAIVRRWGDSRSSALASTAMLFFGICVGFRVGLADCFDGNNGVVYAQAVALIYIMLRVFGMLPSSVALSTAPLGVLAGFLLGTYCLVYESHFALFLLTGATLLVPALWRSQAKGKLVVGIVLTIVVSLGLAATEGGPITDIVQAKLSGRKAPETLQEANVAQHVTMKFPKSELFKVLATSADYMRVSPGFQLGPFRSLTPKTDTEGYISIFSPSFLATHWLPLFTAPLTLIWLIRKRHYPGLAFWTFGAWAYLVPALIDFGPTYELEYFRWEFAAGFGFAVPLGLFCGELLTIKVDDLKRRRLCRAIAVVLLGLALWPAEKMVNRAVIDLQKNGLPPIVPPGDWRVARPELGVTKADIACAQALSKLVTPGEFMITNLGSESPLGLWPDCVISGLSAARIGGRAHPPEGRRLHAHPLYYRSSLQKALMRTGRLDLLEQANVPWLVLDPSRTELDERLAKSPQAKKEFESTVDGATRQLWRWNARPSDNEKVESKIAFQAKAWLKGSGPAELERVSEWRSNSLMTLELQLTNPSQASVRSGWVRLRVEDADGREVTEPLSYRLGNESIAAKGTVTESLPFVTPLGEGEFSLIVEQPTGDTTARELLRVPLRLSLLQRLGALKATLEVPGARPPKTFAPLKLTLSSAEALRSVGELDLRVRYHQDGGDYVWELDRLAIPLQLDIKAGGQQTIDWDIVTPWRIGSYRLEFEVFDHGTGYPVPISTSETRLHVEEPPAR